MYTNSSILTPSSIQDQIFSYMITSDNKYFNSQRYSNVHAAIFLAAIAFFIAIFILKNTFFWLLGKLAVSCRKIKEQFIPPEVASDDFYRDLSVLQLCKEFNKTTIEKRDIESIIRHGLYRRHFDKDMQLYLTKLEVKLINMEERFREFFDKYDIKYVPDGKDSRKQMVKAIGELLKNKEEILKADHRLKSTIYSYDLADNDYYKGVMQVEASI